MTVEEKAARIIRDIREEKGISPVRIFENMARRDYISMHGPEHHVLDGACLLTAYRNAGGEIELEDCLEKLFREGLRMPGAMCGLWGVCGAVTSVGAALAILEGTGPLSSDGTWGGHMAYTAGALEAIGTIDGPRCCKRDGLMALRRGIAYINSRFGPMLEDETPICAFSPQNPQCIGGRCPFYPDTTKT